MSEVTGRCKNCEHFATGRSYPKQEGWGLCVLANGDSGEPDAYETLAFARDAEAYSAWLEISPEFGCVQFEAKK